MSRVGWLDCSAGASGDMLLGALVGAGVPLPVLQQAVAAVAPEPVGLSVEHVHRAGLAATRVHVRVADSASSRTWRDVRAILEQAALDAHVRAAALDTFARLAGAEATAHGQPADDVHFHEVGALDAIADDPDLGLRTALDQLKARADAWRTQYAEPTLADVRAGRPATASAERGRQLFDELRLSFTALQRNLDRAAGIARDDLVGAAERLRLVAALITLGLLVLLVVLTVGLRRVVTRPIAELAAEVRRVAAGNFDSEVHGSGPRELVGLGADVREATERLDQQTKELERSNTELEQFAYVASHDLQEPLRKVASFTQLLERRYKGQLDERADQYIAFAVDGAKRMQVLINDLLSFSRVGRLTREHVELSAGDLVEQALANLSVVIEETGATVTVAEDMPRVDVDQSLMVGVFQNLIGNAIKFREEAPPEIAIDVRDGGEEWEFSVADNGIGIEPEYADRIFVIFQRLHPKDAYPGTGIGLAMCRKIIEYHGGRIWLDTERSGGTTFRFTLPKLETS